MKIGDLNFSVGLRMEILDFGRKVDEITIKSINDRNQRIEVESLKLNPGKTVWFGVVSRTADLGWRMLFEDPLAGGLCYSQRAPIYFFKPI